MIRFWWLAVMIVVYIHHTHCMMFGNYKKHFLKDIVFILLVGALIGACIQECNLEQLLTPFRQILFGTPKFKTAPSLKFMVLSIEEVK
nr:MAG TPA: hypothetical protein [Caudoviricetes sp.]